MKTKYLVLVCIAIVLILSWPQVPVEAFQKNTRVAAHKVKYGTSDLPIDTNNLVEIAAGGAAVYSKPIGLSASSHHSIACTWETTDTGATGSIEVLGWNATKGAFKSFDSAVTKSLTGVTSYDKIFSITVPVVPMIQLKFSGDASHATTFSAVVLNVW